MSTDFENELRDLFREKAGEAPLATPSLPASVPRQVLRRGRLHQVGTVLGSAVVVIALIVGSVTGLTRVLGDGSGTIQTGGYEVFERTATVDAFTVTSPSDWFLVNRWPVATRLSDEGPPDGPSDVFQLSNVDLGLDAAACGNALPAGAAVLTVSFTEAHIIDSDPYGPWPNEFREATQFDACGEGRYADFTLSGWAFFAWIGFGEGVTAADRATLQDAADSIAVADPWEPTDPDETTPAYVIDGGMSESGESWSLELRPGEQNPEMTLERSSGVAVSTPLDDVLFGSSFRPELTDPIFGAIAKAATGVEFRPGTENAYLDLGQSPVTGTIAPIPPTMGAFDFDLFFIDPPEGYADLGGHVIALGVDQPSLESPPPVAEPRDEVVELSGVFEGATWRVAFTGMFADQSACIEPVIGGEVFGQTCHERVEHSFASSQPSSDAWLTDELYMQVSSVVPEVVELRYVGDDDAIVPSQFRCAIGPLGWTDPDRKVCVIVLPPNGSGTLEFLDADGDVLFEQGMGWGLAEPEVVEPMPVNPVHGGTYWAVYPWVGAPGDREADDVSAWLLQEFGIESFPGDLACDEGAAEALGTNAEQGIGVYFETDDEANAFASQAGLLDHTRRVIARVTTYCLD